MTYLNLLNNLLARLRESQVDDVDTTEYTTLMGVYLNDAKREVEDSWNWTQLRRTIDITTEVGTTEYSLGYDITVETERARILGVYNATQDATMHLVSDDYMKRQTLLTDNTQQDSPIYYRIGGQSQVVSGSSRWVYQYVEVFPTPAAVETLTFSLIVPDNELNSKLDTLTVPWRPVVLRAYMLALAERGEDTQSMYARTEQQFNEALGTAIAQDAERVAGELDWIVP